jgi:hypothetical protein
MATMNTKACFSTVVTYFVLASFALAMEGGASARQGSLFNGDSEKRVDAVYDGGPHIFSIGAYAQYQKRAVIYGDGDIPTDWSVNHLMTYLGLDLGSWLTIQGGVGQSTLTVAGDESRDADLEWMGGAQARLLDYMLLEPIIGDDTYWFGLDLNLKYTGSRSEGFGDETLWNETFGSLTMSLTSRPERYGFMDRISLYFGPAVSVIRGTQGDEAISEDKPMGFVGGLMFAPSDNFTFNLEMQSFGDMSFGGGVGLHF